MPFRCGRSRKAEQNGTQPPLLDGAHRLGWFFPVFRGLAAVPMGRRGGHAALRQPGRDAGRPSCRRRLRYRCLAYPAGDIVIGTIVLILASRAPKENRLPFILLAGGLVANLLADSAFAYLTTTNTYGSGSTTDTGWAAGYLLIAVAGFRAATTRAGSAVTNDGTTGRIWLVP